MDDERDEGERDFGHAKLQAEATPVLSCGEEALLPGVSGRQPSNPAKSISGGVVTGCDDLIKSLFPQGFKIHHL